MPMRGAWICGCGHKIASGEMCQCQQRRAKEGQAVRDARRPSARARGYDTRWDKARATFLSHHPRCMMVRDGVMCGKPANVVDHIEPHRGDQAKFWDSSNWQSLCVSCHSSHKQAIENQGGIDNLRRSLPFDVKRSRIPVTIVCGPAGSGKSTFVRTHAGPRDLIIDLDVIRSHLSGEPIHASTPKWTPHALDERNRILRSLAADHVHDRAWFIISAPQGEERTAWRNKLGADRVVLLDVPADECRRRIWADPDRRGQQQRMEDLARDWWKRFTPDPVSERLGAT